MLSARAQVLVLGAHSFIGQCIVTGLLEQTECTIMATGRSAAKLKTLSERLGHSRLSVSVLDALDSAALACACRQSAIVINCIGPYIISGYDIAKTVIENHRHYIDFAFEQFHYRRIKDLSALASANDVALITGAGEVVGISSVLSAYAAERLPGLESLGICYLDGTLPDNETGFSSIMNGALEPALDNQDYVDGRYVTSKMGSELIERRFPEPHGKVKLLSDPTIDSLTLPQRYRLRTVKTYFGMGMEVPFGFFPLMRLLNPYKNRMFYRWTGRIIRSIMRKTHAQQARGRAPARTPLLTVDAQSKDAQMAVEVRFSGQFNGTAILPTLICKMLAQGEISARGLLTAMDVVTPERLLEEFERYRQRGDLHYTITGPAAPRSAIDAAQ